MTAKEFIESGDLELFVYGALPPEENKKIFTAMHTHPEVKQEVEKIEATLKFLAENTSPSISEKNWINLENKLFKKKVKSIDSNQSTNWAAIIGWAASVVLIIGIFWLFNQNNALKNNLVEIQNENEKLLEEIVTTEESLADTRELLTILRDKNIKTVNLPGNTPVAPDAYAKVYYNESSNTIHLDARGLPEPPEGMVYQVWSLKMDPLTPTSIGLLDSFQKDDTKVFLLENIPPSEGFGITLEPAGGSETPTLEQLYTLGVI